MAESSPETPIADAPTPAPTPAPAAAPRPVARPMAGAPAAAPGGTVVSPPSGAEILAKAAAAKAEAEMLAMQMVQDYLREPPRRSETIGQLAAALAAAQGMLTGVTRDSMNPFFKSGYASLAAGIDVIREPFVKNQLAYFQGVTARGKSVVVTTTLAHASGEWIEERLILTAKDDTPQGIGSTITFGRRYGLFAMVGVAPVDDDGEAGSREISKDTRWDKGATRTSHQQGSGASDELPDAPAPPLEPAGVPEPPAPLSEAGGLPAGPVGAGTGSAPAPPPRPVARPRPTATSSTPSTSTTPPPPGMKPPARAPGS